MCFQRKSHQVMSFGRILVIIYVCVLVFPNSSEQQNGNNNLEATHVYGKYNYLGCFFKDMILLRFNYKGILYPLLRISSMCFDSCKDYFSKLNDDDTFHFIAIQHQLCFCIPIPKQWQTNFPVQKISEDNCSLRSAKRNGFNIGGNFEFALYCESNNSCSSKVYNIDDENNVEEEIIQNDTLFAKKIDFEPEISACVTPNCTTRFGYNGEFCRNRTGLIEKLPDQTINNEETMMDFVQKYVPGSIENPELCVRYCRDIEKNNVTIPKYSVLSTVSSLRVIVDGACDYCTDKFGLCHCINDFNYNYSKRFEKCDGCSVNSKCTSISENKLVHVYSEVEETTPYFVNDEVTEKYVDGDCKEIFKCKKTDNYGTEWSACPGERKKLECPQSSHGWMYWTCSDESGKFEDPQPDFTNCTSDALLEIKNQNPKESLKSLEMLIINSEENSTKYFGHEIQNINNLVQTAARNVSAQETPEEHRDTIRRAVRLTGNLIAEENPWNQLSRLTKSETATNLTSSIENVLFYFAQLNDGNGTVFEPSKPFKIHPIEEDREGFVVTLFAWNGTKDGVHKFPQESQSSFIKVVNGSSYLQENTYLVGTLLNSTYLESKTPSEQNSLGKENSKDEKKNFNSEIISLTFSDENVNIPENGIEVKLAHTQPAVGQERLQFRRRLHPGEQRKAVLGETHCAYWNTTTLSWSTDGCKKQKNLSNSHETVCTCNHLTAFAILTDFHNYTGKDKGLEITTLILCPASVFCLIATVICMRLIKVVNDERTTIITHLCINLIIGNVLLLLFVDKEYFFLPDLACRVVGIVTHYVFLCVFGWMAVQGHYIHCQIVLIFPSEDNVPKYIRCVYTFPFIIVGLTVAIGFGLFQDNPYGGSENVMYCWLNGHYIWAFMAPLAIVLLGNIWMMIVMHKQVHRKRMSKLVTSNANSFSDNKKMTRGYISVSVLLGLTWISGFFTFLDTPTFLDINLMSYVFTVLNASQGIFIFIFHCLLHEKFQQLLTTKYGKYLNTKKTKLNLLNKNGSYSSSRSVPKKRRTSTEISKEKEGTENVVSNCEEFHAFLNGKINSNNKMLSKGNDRKINESAGKCIIENEDMTENNLNKLRKKPIFPWMQEMLQSKLFLRHKGSSAYNKQENFAIH